MGTKRKIAGIIVHGRVWLMIVILIVAGWSATMIGRTRINYDLTRYLSEETMTRKSLEVMREEFGSAEQLRIMFSDRTGEEIREILNILNAREEIRAAVFSEEENVRQADGHVLQLITLTLRECDTAALVEDLRTLFPEAGEYFVGGSAADQLDVQRSVAQEIPAVMVISVAIVLLVLLLTSHAWLEPVVILIPLAVSILINMGTNFIFPDVSFITFAVCAILQLALSIDYAIMLLHTYNACCDDGMKAEEAMTEALAQCFMRIASSAMTTVAGLLSLMFMSFTMGFDIGVVLSKGIIISMLGVFLLMPSLILLLKKPLRKTRHKPVPLGGIRLAKVICKAAKPVAAVLIVAVLCGAYLTSRNTYSFSARSSAADSGSDRINREFGASNPLVLLVPGGREDEDYEKQRLLADKLYEIRRGNGDGAVSGITAMVTDGAEALRYYSADDVAELTGQSKTAVSLFFMMNGFDVTVRADRLLEAAGMIAEGNAQVMEMRNALTSAREALEGPNYSRMVAEPAFQPSDADFNECMDRILAAAHEVYGDSFYITGAPMSVYDIGNAFRSDLLVVNFITLLAILLIVALSFRSFRLPVLLVFVIEGAIWITMGISRLIGQPIFFVSYLICLSIQMGATIDYGILMCDQYREMRRSGKAAAEAMKEAMRKSLPTILTSGTILVTAGYIIGKQCSIYYISSIGSLLARGALLSAVLVLTLLPALLFLFDRFIIRTGD